MKQLLKILVIFGLSIGLLTACSSSSSNSSTSQSQNKSSQNKSSLSSNRFNYGTVSYNPSATGIPSFYTPPSSLPNKPSGTLIRYEKVTGVPQVPTGATVYRIMFISKTIYNKEIPESGYAIVPPTKAPAGGYTVLSWAHGTTGAAPICAPSLFEGSIYLTPGLNYFLADNFLIAATDYEGLGTSVTIHPYLLGQSEGQGVLDAAKAAQQLPGVDVSNKVFIYGHSQGGQSALFAGQLAKSYAPSLNVLGVVAAAPATGFPLIVDVLASDNAVEGFTVTAAWTWSKTYKDLSASTVFTPTGIEVASKYVGSVCTNTLDGILSKYPANVMFKANAAKSPIIQKIAIENNPGNSVTDAPMLVVQGTADTTVLPILTDTYVKSACLIKDSIDYVHVPGATHGTVVEEEAQPISQWMQAIASGTPNNSTCALNPDYVTGPATGVS